MLFGFPIYGNSSKKGRPQLLQFRFCILIIERVPVSRSFLRLDPKLGCTTLTLKSRTGESGLMSCVQAHI